MSTSSASATASASTGASGAGLPDVRGRILWHDLMTPDIARSHAFYSAVFGWGMQKWEGPHDYTMWTIGGDGHGGYVAFPPDMMSRGTPPHWITYFGVPDVDAAGATAVAMGATKHFAEDVAGAGRFTMLQDPQGAWFMLYAPTNIRPGAPDQPVVPGDASWHELWTSDPQAGYDFYLHLLGWESAGEFEDPTIGVYRMFGRSGQPLGGVTQLMTGMKDIPPNWLPYFRVDDLEASVQSVKDNGGTILVGPMDVPGGDRVAQCLDVMGGPFALHEPVRP